MSLRGFATINYWADDVEAAAAWYADLLGVEPYFSRPGPDGRPAYVEFRIGDHEAELGLVSRAFAPPGQPERPGGAVMYWHVDDLEGTFARLLEMGATEYQPVTPRGEGFVTGAVVDPFGNVLGVMTNAHYVRMLE
ncbi:VOC family protein [Myceligenerans xiligouense]|uniref:Putative glyoxalase superfamily protein PhnB n=1 Tax=Myceligenerans xiligouense TaxID=253184 RepID=A0A3N4YN65_9MICO|nr:VOC family protein [Myceligenerans xiligouense]RPF21557.1 putative glyoxalase superfamily protein PhnB [Myceligenerans xiligouense]